MVLPEWLETMEPDLHPLVANNLLDRPLRLHLRVIRLLLPLHAQKMERQLLLTCHNLVRGYHPRLGRLRPNPHNLSPRTLTRLGHPKHSPNHGLSHHHNPRRHHAQFRKLLPRTRLTHVTKESLSQTHYKRQSASS